MSEIHLGLVRQPLREQIRDNLRQRIAEGEFMPGDRIYEVELAAAFGVSRIPVREAIRMLEIDGFVEVRSRRGVTVRAINPAEIDSLFDIRAVLEPLAARRAAERADDAGRARLRMVLTEARRAIDGRDAAQEIVINEDFHDLVVDLAGNSVLKGILDPLQGRLHWLLRRYEDPQRIWDEHDALCRAIEAGHADDAARAALEHVLRNKERALHVLLSPELVKRSV